MADRVLPSRERVDDLGCTAGSPEEAEDIEAILVAYRTGRLVDREAIDTMPPDWMSAYERIGWEEAMASIMADPVVPV